jgi:soluble cytochrome b562
MKLPHIGICVGLALAALFVAPLALATVQDPPKPPGKPEGKPEGRPEREHHEEAGLEGAMQALNGAMKRMGKAIEKPDLEAVAKTAVEMQKAVLAAKVEKPEKTAEQADDKAKAAFVLGFRKQMITLERALLDLETAALDGKADEAKKIFAETVAPMKKEGHGKYKD